jgi:hypothetical protein
VHLKRKKDKKEREKRGYLKEKRIRKGNVERDFCKGKG